MENVMRFVMALLLGMAALIVCLLGLAWILIALVPFYVMGGVAIYIIVRSNRRRAAMAAAIEREALQERRLNEQEFKAWRAAVEDSHHKASRRDRILRRFDGSRDP